MDHVEINPMTDEPANKSTHLYQPLQMNQCDRDAIYQDTLKPEEATQSMS